MYSVQCINWIRVVIDYCTSALPYSVYTQPLILHHNYYASCTRRLQTDYERGTLLDRRLSSQCLVTLHVLLPYTHTRILASP